MDIEKESSLNKRDIVFILFIFILAIIPFYKAGTTGIISKTDAEFRFAPIMDFLEFAYLWVPRYSLGMDSFYHWLFPQLPYIGISAFLRYIGFPLWLINRMALVLIMFFLGFGMYYLIRQIVKSRIAAFISAVFYMYNNFIESILDPMHINNLLAFATFAWLVSFLYKGLYNSERIRYALYFGLITIFLIIAPISLGIFLILLFFFLLFHFIIFPLERNRTVDGLKFIIITGVITFCINAWWFLPFIFRAKLLTYPYNLESQIPTHLEHVSRFVSFLELLGNGKSKLETMLSILLLIFISLPLIFSVERKKVLFWGWLVFIGIFLAKGICEPYGGIYRWLYLNMPGFGIYRSPGHFTILIIFGFAVLLGVGVNKFISFMIDKGRLLKYFSTLISLSILLGILGVKGRLLSGNLYGAFSTFIIPNYYWDYADWLNKEKGDFRVAVPNVDWYIKYKWAMWDMPIIHKFISPKPIIDEWTGQYSQTPFPIIKKVFEGFHCLSSECVEKLFGFLGVKYIIAHNDVEVNPCSGTDPRLRKGQLKRLREIDNKRRVGMLDLYEIDKGYIFPKIYSSQAIVDVNGGIDLLEYLLYTNVLSVDRVFLFGDVSGLPEKLYNNRSKLVVLNKFTKYKNPDNSVMYIEKNCGWERFYKRPFYIPKSGNYKAYIKLTPNVCEIVEEQKIGWQVDFGDSRELEAWKKSVCNVNYNSCISKNGLSIFSIEFDGNSSEDEFIQIRREGVAIDLEQHPYMSLTYKLIDPRVQLIQMVIGVDFDNNGSVDAYFKGVYIRSPDSFFQEYKVDIYNKLKRDSPDKERYVIRELEIYPHKEWGADCSGINKNEYLFYLEKLFFYKPTSAISTVNSKLEVDPTGLDKPIDLKEYPIMEIVTSGIYNRAYFEGLSFCLDFDNDNKIDREYIIDNAPFYKRQRGRRNLINIYKLIRSKFPEELNYNLIQFTIAKPYDKIIESVRFISHQNVPVGGFSFNQPVLEIDNVNYNLRKYNLLDKEIIFTKELFLSKGWHRITNPLIGEDDSFKWDWLIIEPIKIEWPSLVSNYRKINPTRYLVSVFTDDSFWLAFNDTYSKDWKAYILKDAKETHRGLEWSALWNVWVNKGKRVEIKDHYVVNGFANGWWVDKNLIKMAHQGEKEIDIILEYIPQRWFEVGLIITLLGLVGINCIIIKRKIKRRYG